MNCRKQSIVSQRLSQSAGGNGSLLNHCSLEVGPRSPAHQRAGWWGEAEGPLHSLADAIQRVIEESNQINTYFGEQTLTFHLQYIHSAMHSHQTFAEMAQRQLVQNKSNPLNAFCAVIISQIKIRFCSALFPDTTGKLLTVLIYINVKVILTSMQ